MIIAGRIRGIFPPVLLLSAILLAGCSGAETRKMHYLEKAQSLLEQRLFDKAQIELRNALQIDPNFVPARLLMGDLAVRLNDPRRALQMYQSVLDQDATNLEARAGVAKIYVFASLPEKALEVVEAGLVQAPDDPALLTVRGAARARMGDLAGATADAERALAASPQHENAVALLASLHLREGRDADALALVEGALRSLPENVDLRLILAEIHVKGGRTDDAERTLREVVELLPEDLSHRYTLARFLAGHERIDDAEQVLRGAIEQNPESLEAKSTLIGMLASRKSIGSAEKALVGFVEAEPKNMELRLALGDFYTAAGRAADAAEAYRAVVKRDGTAPQGLAARNRLAAAAIRERRVDDAAKLIEEVLVENPQDNDALTMRAELALSKGDTAAAVTDLRTVLRDQPGSVPVQRALAQAYLRSGDEALAEETIKKAVEMNPTDRNLRADFARMLVRTGQTERALQILQAAVAEAPEDLAAQEQIFLLHLARKDLKQARVTASTVKSARPDLALGHYLTGLVDRAEGSAGAAIAAYEAALKLQPDAAEPLTGLVQTLVSEKRADVAVARLEATAAAQPDNAVARNLLGELLMTQKRNADAIVAFDAAIEAASGWWVPYRGKAFAQIAAGDTAAATQSLTTGLGATGGAISLGVDLASLQERLGRPEQAIATYQRMLEKSPQNDLLANNLAMLLVTHRTDAKSLELAGQLAERFKDSNEPAFANTSGWVTYKLGRYAEAIPALQRAADRDPQAPLLRYHLAMAQFKVGRVEDARKNLEAALDAGTSFPGMDEARTTLERLKSS